MAIQTTRTSRHQTTPPTQSTQPRMWTPAAFRARCQQLMEIRGAGWWSGRAVDCEVAPGGATLGVEVTVASARVEGLRYPVRYDARSDLAHCSCVAASRGHPCWHAGVGRAYGRRLLEQNRATQLCAEREAAWEGNERAIWPSL